MRKIVVLAGIAMLTAGFASNANAIGGYLAEFQAKYPNTTNITCGVCHTTQAAASSTRNPYGAAFGLRPHATPAARNLAFTFIEKLDSDADGYTNLTEITATTPAVNVLPGFATANAAFPAPTFRPTPARLLFFDNFSNIVATTIPNWVRTTGGWRGNTVVGNVLLTSPLAAAETFANPAPPVALPLLTGFGSGSIEVRAQLLSVAAGDQADVVFGQTPATFRLVGISGNEITIGQDGGVASRFVNGVFGDFNPHLLRIVIGPRTAAGSVVTVFVDGTRIGARRFPNVARGQVGIRTKLTRARFDDFRVSR